MNESQDPISAKRMTHVYLERRSHGTYEGAMSHVKELCNTSTSHVTNECVFTYV